MFSPWPGLAPPVIVPGYVLRIRVWASEHKNAKNTRTVDCIAWAAIAHDKHLDHHNFLITTALIWWSDDQPSKCARSLVALRLLSVAALGTPGHGHGRADFQRHGLKVTGLIYATSPGSKSLVFSSSDAKAKSTWRVKDNEKEKARQGCGNHLDISRVQFFKSGMGVQQGWVLFRQLCKRPLFENLWCQLSMSMSITYRIWDSYISLLLSPSSVPSSWVRPTLRDQAPPSSSPALA